jgi:hypothetical protein
MNIILMFIINVAVFLISGLLRLYRGLLMFIFTVSFGLNFGSKPKIYIDRNDSSYDFQKKCYLGGRKMSRKTSDKDENSIRKIEAKRKDLIIQTVHEKIKTLKMAKAAPLDRAKETKTWLEQQDEVESVKLIGESDITVKFKDGTRVGIMLNRKNLLGGGDHNGASAENSPVLHGRTLNATAKGDPHPISNRACVIDTLYDDWIGPTTSNTIVNILRGAGYDVDLIKSGNVTLDFFSNLDDKEYGIVFILTHGGMMEISGDDKLHLMARPFFTSFPPSPAYSGVGIFAVETLCVPQGWAYVYAFNDLFVKQYIDNKYFPNSLFHLLSCHGADPKAQNDMIQTFLSRGVGCYSGWTKSVSGSNGCPAAIQFFQVLCDSSASPTNTVADAIAQITASGRSPDPYEQAVLVSYGSSNMQIINYFILKEASHVVIRDPTGKAIKKGFHDILDAMEYAENQINCGKHSKLKITQTVELKKVQW